jgi:hypothetical protein
VQYYILEMMAEDTGDYFTEYQRDSFKYSAKTILETRFCG